MQFSVLASGSKADCTFIEYNGSRILIDCGLSARETSNRLLSLGIDPSTIAAILVTHEHYDHVRGLSIFTKRFGTPVVTARSTARMLHSIKKLDSFNPGEEFGLGSFEVSAVSISHDAVDPVGYVISGGGFKLAHFTDLGKVTTLVKNAVTACDALVLESNHDLEMLQCCSYPWELKQRIASNVGHLSNLDAAELVREIQHPKLQAIVLAHISENSNTPRHAYDATKEIFDALTEPVQPEIVCANPYSSTKFFNLAQEAVCSGSVAVGA